MSRHVLPSKHVAFSTDTEAQGGLGFRTSALRPRDWALEKARVEQGIEQGTV